MAQKQKRKTIAIDPGLHKVVKQWSEGTDYSLARFIASSLIDFVQQLEELKKKDDSLFKDELGDVERGNKLHAYAREHQISWWAYQFYCQYNLPRAVDYKYKPDGDGPIQEVGE